MAGPGGWAALHDAAGEAWWDLYGQVREAAGIPDEHEYCLALLTPCAPLIVAGLCRTLGIDPVELDAKNSSSPEKEEGAGMVNLTGK